MCHIQDLIEFGRWNDDNAKKMWKHFRLDTYEDLFITHTNNKSAKYITDIIKNNKQLKNVLFMWFNINVKIISNGLKYNTCLKCIEINYCTISNYTLKYFGKILQHNNTLEIIKFIDCNIDDKGYKYICQGLKYNKYLKSIKLASDNLTDSVVKYICNSLLHNKYCIKLSICYNNMNNKGAKHICRLLKCNKYLEKFSIYPNNANLKGELSILKALQFNDTLEKINIEYFLIDEYHMLNITNIEYIYNILKYYKNITTIYHAIHYILDNPHYDGDYNEESILYFRKIQEYIQEITSRNEKNIVQKGIMLLNLL